MKGREGEGRGGEGRGGKVRERGGEGRGGEGEGRREKGGEGRGGEGRERGGRREKGGEGRGGKGRERGGEGKGGEGEGRGGEGKGRGGEGAWHKPQSPPCRGKLTSHLMRCCQGLPQQGGLSVLKLLHPLKFRALGTVIRNRTKISVAQSCQILCLHERQPGTLPSFEMFMGQPSS
jgi:hypothetical protein